MRISVQYSYVFVFCTVLKRMMDLGGRLLWHLFRSDSEEDNCKKGDGSELLFVF